MRHQVQFRQLMSEDRFTLNPDDVKMVTEIGGKAAIRVTWTTEEFFTEESYEDVLLVLKYSYT